MTNDWIKLLMGLIQRTREGKLEWKQHAEQGSFQVVIGDYTVVMSLLEKERGGPDVFIKILDDYGNTVDGFADTNLTNDDWELSEPPFKMMFDLYNTARRQALGADKAIKSILSELGQET